MGSVNRRLVECRLNFRWGCRLDFHHKSRQECRQVCHQYAGNAVGYTSNHPSLVKAESLAVWIAVRDAMGDRAPIIGQIHALGITDSQSIGKKCHQIAECKSLLAINRDLCFAVMAIVKERNLPKSIQIPKEKLLRLADNPWIQQYVELYQ